MLAAPLPAGLEAGIREAHAQMCGEAGEDLLFAVRSSATAEDLPDASFAGQQETFLNIRGADNLLDAVKRCFASLYNDRAIAYRVHHGFAHEVVALSAGIQRMVRSDKGAAGVMFTLDTESGFRDVILINAAYGLGETVVQGTVNPDEFYVHKPTLARGHRSIIRKKLGDKAIRMVFTSEATAERSTRVEEVPAVVGTGEATRRVPDGIEVTVSCAEGEDGRVYQGLLRFEKSEVVMQAMPEIPVKIMMNVGNPEQAFHFALLLHDGVGLARLEFIINTAIGIHPNAALEYDKLSREDK